MRKQILIGCILVIIASVLVIIIARRDHPLEKVKSIKSPSIQEGKREPASTAEKLDGLPNKIAQAVMEKAGGAQAFLTYLELRELKKQGEVNFFARLIDQHSAAVSGATFDFVLHYYDPNNFRATNGRGEVFPLIQTTNLTLLTDTEGGIALSGMQGTQLDVKRIKKEGYAIEIPPYLSFSYGSRLETHLPPYWERKQPRIFKAWKQGDLSRLIPVQATIRYRNMVGNEKSVRWFINLISGQVSEQPVEGADLAVTVSLIQPGNGKEDYGQLLVESLNGALAVTDHSQPFQAPDSLSGNKWECLLDQKYRNNNGVRQNVYLKLRSGKLWFGGEIDARTGPTLTIRGFINPDGSRNLEPDPEKSITDPEEIRRVDEATRVR